MDMSNSINKVVDTLEKNATLFAFAGSFAARAYADPTANEDPMNLITNIPMELSNLSQHPMDVLKWKLLNSPHAYTMLFKVGLAAYVAGQFGLIPSKYTAIGKKVATGAGIAAILLKGGGPYENKSMVNGNSVRGTPATATQVRTILG